MLHFQTQPGKTNIMMDWKEIHVNLINMEISFFKPREEKRILYVSWGTCWC